MLASLSHLTYSVVVLAIGIPAKWCGFPSSFGWGHYALIAICIAFTTEAKFKQGFQAAVRQHSEITEEPYFKSYMSLGYGMEIFSLFGLQIRLS